MSDEPQHLANGAGRRRRPLVLGAAVAGVVLLSGCAKNSPQDTWKPEGSPAKKIDHLQKPVFLVAGIVGVLVFLAVLWCVIRYRDRGQPIPKQTHGKPALEIGLTILPFLILVAVAIPTGATILDLADTKNCNATVNVTGQQWWWEYDYPATQFNASQYGITEPITTSGELVIPEDTCVLLRITSRDVIHSFWIPSLNGKKDAVPGRVHDLKLEADQPGYYSGQCTEFCGLSHANMRMRAVSLTLDDFKTWVSKQLQNAKTYDETDQSPEALGYRAFRSNCARCHTVNGMLDDKAQPLVSAPEQAIVAGAVPNLTHLMSRTWFAGETFPLWKQECLDRLTKAKPEEIGGIYLGETTPECFNRTELEAWLRNPPGMKPMYEKPDDQGRTRGMPNLQLSEDAIDSLITYLQTLS